MSASRPASEGQPGGRGERYPRTLWEDRRCRPVFKSSFPQAFAAARSPEGTPRFTVAEVHSRRDRRHRGPSAGAGAAGRGAWDSAGLPLREQKQRALGSQKDPEEPSARASERKAAL